MLLEPEPVIPADMAQGYQENQGNQDGRSRQVYGNMPCFYKREGTDKMNQSDD